MRGVQGGKKNGQVSSIALSDVFSSQKPQLKTVRVVYFQLNQTPIFQLTRNLH
jgi:hypothetical protein